MKTKIKGYFLCNMGFKNIEVAEIDNEFYVGLNTALTNLGLNLKDENVQELGIVTERVELMSGKTKKRIEVIDWTTFNRLYELRNSKRAETFYQILLNHKFALEHNFDRLTPNDLESMEARLKFIEERNILISKNEVLKREIEDKLPYIEVIKSVFGTSQAPVNFMNLPDKLKYSKRFSLTQLCEELRQAGVFDKYDIPKKHYVNNGYFKVIVVTEQRHTNTKRITQVLVMKKGIYLIESIIDKKYGGKYI